MTDFLSVYRGNDELELITPFSDQEQITVAFAKLLPRSTFKESPIWDISFSIGTSGSYILANGPLPQVESESTSNPTFQIISICVDAIEQFLEIKNRPKFCSILPTNDRLVGIINAAITQELPQFDYTEKSRDYVVDEVLKEFNANQYINNLYTQQSIEEYISGDARYFERIDL